MARSTVAVFEARRKVVDGELASLADEHRNIDNLTRQLQRRREILDGRFELLVAERDLLDERLWRDRDGGLGCGPQPPVVGQRMTPPAPRDLAPEAWDFDALDAALAC
ncbi:MAG: hypothetical protein K0V04_27005 [Deltaproteobacteria bacterium]|nr:hypothetical protein [Deltaproteobacteria bacterium]